MLAAIFCPGPSLAKLDCDDIASEHDVTYAVNTALKIITTDWLSAGDVTVQRMLDPLRPRCGIITLDKPEWSNVNYTLWKYIPLIDDHKKRGRPINWSLQAALCHAATIGAKKIFIYGCDLLGQCDATGYKGEDRSPDRWKREASDLAFTALLLHERGVYCERVIP